MKRNLEVELLSLLSAATKEGKISWNHVGGDCYRSTSGLYHLRWLYWYNDSGLTLGRQGLIVAFQDQHLTFPWGTDGMEAAKKLLNVVDDKWPPYHLRLVEGCKSMLPTDMIPIQITRMQQTCLMALSLLLHATKSGAMTWKQDSSNPDAFYSHINNSKVEIVFLKPIDYEGTPIGSLIAELSLETANIPFACGTDGYFLIEEILSFSVPEFQRKVGACEAALAKEIDFLERMIRHVGEV